MSIGTYSELQTAVANWLSDSSLTSRITEGIVLAEAKMNRYLRVKDMVTKDASFSITGEYVAVPSNFGGVKTFYLNTSDKAVLDFMPDALITNTYPSGTGQPRVYNVQGTNFRFGPPPDATYTATLVYWLLVPALSVSNTTNWMLTSNPDAYLYGTLAEMAVLRKQPDAAQGYWSLMYQALDQIKQQSHRDSYAGDAALVARPG